MSPRCCILCLTDLSKRGYDTGALAALFAARLHAKLVVAHANESNHPLVIESAADTLADDTDRLRATGVMVVPSFSKSIPVTTAVIDLLRAHKPRLVLHSVPRGPDFFESNANQIACTLLRESSVPVFIVSDLAPFQAWGPDRNRLTVLVALDFDPGSVAVLRWAKELRGFGPCDLVFFHASSHPEFPRLSEFKALQVEPTNSPERQEALESALHEITHGYFDPTVDRLIVRPTWQSPELSILEAATSVGADLIVTGNHRRNGLGRIFHPSTSRALVNACSHNLVCVPILPDPEG